MNKHILMIMDSLANPIKYTFEQLRKNRDEAYDAVAAADAAADAAAYYAARAAYAYFVVHATYAYDAAAADNVNYWLYIYFKRSGENRQDYIDEITKGYKHE